MTKIYDVVVKKPNKITSGFGMRKHPITGEYKKHNGIDIISKANPKDLNIYAIDDGVVQKVVTGKDKATTGYGNYIWVRYSRYDLSLLHAHCSKINLKKGDKVKYNDVIAIMGKTGAATGVHLHLGMTKIGSDVWLDPTKYDMLPDKYNLTRLLKKGCEGSDVKELQKELKNKSYDIGKTGVDGKFGNKTKSAVEKFQKANKLKVDGIVGKDTAHALGWTYKNK